MGTRPVKEFNVRIDRKVVECMDITVKATSPRAARARAMALMNKEVSTDQGEYVSPWAFSDLCSQPKIGEVTGG